MGNRRPAPQSPRLLRTVPIDQISDGPGDLGADIASHRKRDLQLSEVQKPRVAAQVALSLLEALRSVDSPGEKLENEVIARTIPRRLGLSEVVGRQIELYREHARRGRKISDEELAEFTRLVKKRPDAAKVFFEMGTNLADEHMPGRKWWQPRVLRFRMVRRATKRTLRKLFGQRVGGFVSGTFSLEVSASPLVQMDSTGDACALVTGFCQRAVRKGVGGDLKVVKHSCETQGDRVCKWSLKG